MSNSASGTERIHATVIALGDKAALIRGPSGAGKSDLALRCIAAPPAFEGAHRIELVADDQVLLRLTDRGIEAAPPPTIAGRLEVRGLGIVDVPFRSSAIVVLAVDLVAPEQVPRFPLEEISTVFFGLRIPTLRLTPFEASAPIKVTLALARAEAPGKSP